MWADEKVEQVIEGSDSEESDLNVSTLEKQLDQLAHETSFREARETFSSMKQSSEENTTTYFLRIIYGYIIMEGRSKLMAKRKGVKVSKLYAGGEVVDATMKLSASEEPISKVCASYARDYVLIVKRSFIQEWNVHRGCRMSILQYE
ncbi:SLC13A2_3_5 [Lepeophtheirus salmonis]|uniref:SLC13A2_3_5 n=1 Tax=Lepeophtheirus salmonis TaxID=72036 RepID=A0A7R8H1C0_LEPSM|nr:SLC13A2_3_5 [Lepeophtheirus salmonis]CAF2804691.1 SLC13A2_3_5 [Lepeophtheirus salmonis]